MLKHLKHHWKRAASGLMALVMAAGLLPGTSLAAETAATPVIQTEAAYAPTGNFELNVAGTTAWNGGESWPGCRTSSRRLRPCGWSTRSCPWLSWRSCAARR